MLFRLLFSPNYLFFNSLPLFQFLFFLFWVFLHTHLISQLPQVILSLFMFLLQLLVCTNLYSYPSITGKDFLLSLFFNFFLQSTTVLLSKNFKLYTYILLHIIHIFCNLACFITIHVSKLSFKPRSLYY